MEKREPMDLNRNVRFYLANLSQDGNNIESFFERAYKKFVIEHSERTDDQKTKILLTGQLDGSSQGEIEQVMSKATFIKYQLDKADKQLNQFSNIQPPVYEKLIKWRDFLFNKDIKQIAGFDFGEKEPPLSEPLLDEVFDLLIDRALPKQDRSKFVRSFRGETIEGPMTWLWTAHNKKDKNGNPYGDRTSVLTLIKCLFDSVKTDYKRTAYELFVDIHGNKFVSVKGGITTGGKLNAQKITEGIKKIRDKYLYGPGPQKNDQ